MIFAVLLTPSGTKHYRRLPMIAPVTSKAQVVVLNGILVEGLYEKTGPYCPIRFEDPNAGKKARKVGIQLDPEKVNWSHLPPRRNNMPRR